MHFIIFFNLENYNVATKSLRHLCTNYRCGICYTNMIHIKSLQTEHDHKGKKYGPMSTPCYLNIINVTKQSCYKSAIPPSLDISYR